ncbi:hypothetical protein [Plantactinospora sp. B24E8]
MIGADDVTDRGGRGGLADEQRRWDEEDEQRCCAEDAFGVYD